MPSFKMLWLNVYTSYLHIFKINININTQSNTFTYKISSERYIFSVILTTPNAYSILIWYATSLADVNWYRIFSREID